MPRKTSQARHRRRGTGGRFAALAAPAAVMALMSAGAVAPHPRSPVAPSAPAVAANEIATVAGGLGGPGKATTVALFPACHLAFRAGLLYITDDGAVRTVSLRTDSLANLAGTGSIAPLGDGGPATKATVGACGVAFDHSGNLVIADENEVGRIRVVAARTGTFYGQAMTKGDIYTVAGDGTDGFSGDGGPATQAELFNPEGIAIGAAGGLVIADTINGRIRVVG
jgi:hypothetical protein